MAEFLDSIYDTKNIIEVLTEKINKNKLSELSDDIFIPSESDKKCKNTNVSKYNNKNIDVYLIDMSMDNSDCSSILIEKIKNQLDKISLFDNFIIGYIYENGEIYLIEHTFQRNYLNLTLLFNKLIDNMNLFKIIPKLQKHIIIKNISELINCFCWLDWVPSNRSFKSNIITINKYDIELS